MILRSRPYRWSSDQLFLILVGFVYALSYGFLLSKTDGLPYVMDNNESFSSLWHAANLYNFGVATSYGLADEAFATHEAAHPYVHTHQGNFPRVFAFAIYALGARTIEAQIVITTLLVGLPAILLLYLFLARIASPAFAALAAAVFMTDYVLFAQWQVVTYRVWHCFFLFLCLLAVHRAAEEGGRRWLALTLGAFACLFYYELVFAAFVAAWCGCYALVISAKRPRRLLQIGAAATAGMVLALAAVVAQVVGYLGPGDFRRDIYLTFAARNDFSSVASFFEEAARFYESRRVVFWHNVQDRDAFAGFAPFFRSFTAFDWRVHTPLFAVAIWILAVGWVLGLVPPRRDAKLHRIAVGSVCLGLFLGALVLVLLIDGAVFEGHYAPLWNRLYALAGPQAVLVLVPLAAALVALYIAVRGADEAPGHANRLMGVLKLLLCGAIAYALIYAISPGYVYSGYLSRHAPFTVFLTDIVVALGLYAAGSVAIRTARRAIASTTPNPLSLYLRCSFAGMAALLVVFLYGYWLLMQVSYVTWMPPNHYAFLKKLSEPPYRGASFVVNSYAAPVAAFTGQWAYFDPLISQGNPVRTTDRTYLAGDARYLWFADRDVNESYRRPDYFVCMIPQAPELIANRLLHDIGRFGQSGCSQLSLVRQAKDLEIEGVRLVEHDESGLQRSGFDSWAIVKLDWAQSAVAAIEWVRPMRQAAAARPEMITWRSSGDERLHKNAIVFHVPVMPEVTRHIKMLTVPGYAALALENNGFYLSLSSKTTVVDRENVQIRTAYLRYAGKKDADVYTYNAGVLLSASVDASQLSFPVEVDVSRIASGFVIVRVYPPLAKLLPAGLLDRIEFKLQSLIGHEAQRRMIGYLDRLSEQQAVGREFEGMLEAIALESHNRPGDASSGIADSRGLFFELTVFLTVLGIGLVGFPVFLLVMRSRRIRRTASK